MTQPIQAFCIDFNWAPRTNGPSEFAAPGLWANADPAEHVAWYQSLGANVIQTFCVSCNGYAWYQGGEIPAQPKLKHDFLPEVVRLGHANGMQVMGYFCIGSNTLWAQREPEQSYGDGTGTWCHIPLTRAYNAYLGQSIREAMSKADIDGFMIDWVWNPERSATNGRWLDAEKEAYHELMGQEFPGEEALTDAAEAEYGRRAIERCWASIRSAARSMKANAIVWLSCNDIGHPHLRENRMLREVDWLMNEHPDQSAIQQAREASEGQAEIMQCLCGWGEQHDAARIAQDATLGEVGYYGFAIPDLSSFPPEVIDEQAPRADFMRGNLKNIEAIRQVYHRVIQ